MSGTAGREETAGATADRVVLSYPTALSDRGRWRLGQEYYREYLKKTLGAVSEGDRRDEFTDVGCCGSSMHVTLVVETVEGGEAVGADTAIEYATRENCDRETEGGWEVQNEID